MNDALIQKAYALHRAGRMAEAAQLYQDVLRTEPTQKDALFFLGLLHLQRADFEAALGCYNRLIAADANNADAHLARGTALSNLGRHAEALAAYDRAVTLKAGHTVVWNHRGNALLELARYADALQSYDRAISLKPDYAEAWRHRGIAALQAGLIEDALASFDKAIALNPDDAVAREERGNLFMRLHRHAEAVADYDRVLAGRSGSPDLFYNRANAQSILKNYAAAIRDCERALDLSPDYPYARGVLVHSKLQSCEWSGLDEQKAEISASLAAGKPVISPFNLKALSDSPEEQMQCARIWTARECPPSAPLWRGEHYNHDRIRIAYVSADLNTSAVATLMAGVFEAHDRGRFEAIACSLGPATTTPMRTRLEAGFERFIDVSERSDQDIARLIQSLEVDIAVDLMGYTGACRPRILAARPAPVQVNFLGFPGTMGASYMDYIVADRTVIPESQTSHYTEMVAYLPDCFLPSDASRRISSKPLSRSGAGLPDKGFVFCCFNNAYKLLPATFDIWMRLLARVPESVLWLSEPHPLAMSNLRREAAARGVTPERLVFAPPIGPVDEHLARLKLADIFLDTLPYNAHTTASDALWAGVPLLTCLGGSLAGRVAASLLNALGLPELITYSPDQYEARALELARNPSALNALRQKLTRQRDVAPLFDTVRYTRNLESAYATMWQTAQAGRLPTPFAVAPVS